MQTSMYKDFIESIKKYKLTNKKYIILFFVMEI